MDSDPDLTLTLGLAPSPSPSRSLGALGRPRALILRPGLPPK